MHILWKIWVIWSCFILKHSLNVCFPETTDKDSAHSILDRVKMRCSQVSCSEGGRDAAASGLHQAPPCPWACPAVSRSLGILRSVMRAVCEMNYPRIPLSLHVLSSEGKPVVIPSNLTMTVTPILAWLAWCPERTEASRYAIFCPAVPNCFTLDKVTAHFLTDTWTTVYDLLSHNSSSYRARHCCHDWQGGICLTSFT